jgi:hypothetical protein
MRTEPLTYRAQLQEQHQEGGDAPAPGNLDPSEGPVPDGAGDDDIINDILGDQKERRREPREPRERDRRREPPPEREEPTDELEDPPEPVDDPEPDEDPPDEDDDLDEEDIPEAAEREEEPVQGSTKAARAALKAGDIDKAFMLAFGKRPEEVAPNPHVWTAWRKANEREEQTRAAEKRQIASERAQFEQAAYQEKVRLNGYVEQLKPYEKYMVAEQAWQREGDPTHLVTIIQGITGMTYDEAQKVILTKTKRSPAERAMQQRLQQLEAKLQETTAEREHQQTQQTQAQIYQQDLAYIRQNVTGPITKIAKFEQRIYNVLAKTRNAAGLTLTVEQAAQKVIRAEKRKIENHPFVRRKPKPGTAPARTAARTPARGTGQRPPLRRDSQNNGAANKDAESDDDIISDILRNRRRVG